MDFGIWVEPEMVSPDSDLYRAHPDWALSIPGRTPVQGRSQLVLDLGRQDVIEYLYGCLSDLLRSHDIRYVKWDMNRSLTDVFSRELLPERQGETAHRYLLGLYSFDRAGKGGFIANEAGELFIGRGIAFQLFNHPGVLEVRVVHSTAYALSKFGQEEFFPSGGRLIDGLGCGTTHNKYVLKRRRRGRTHIGPYRSRIYRSIVIK
ncbi:MAG: alpha-galactosidase [Candidatus Faecousia sp.]|nr:alpha-galactosidase [Candidatus Faecousia sp.]